MSAFNPMLVFKMSNDDECTDTMTPRDGELIKPWTLLKELKLLSECVFMLATLVTSTVVIFPFAPRINIARLSPLNVTLTILPYVGIFK